MVRRSLLGCILLLVAVQAQSPASFRLPLPVSFVPEAVTAGISRQQASNPTELLAHPEGAPDETWIFTDRVALKLNPQSDLSTVLAGRALSLSRTIEPGLFILQASDARAAWWEAKELSRMPEVVAAYPVHHSPKTSNDSYAAAPKDEFFRTLVEVPPCEIAPGVIVPGQIVTGQWYLENRDPVSGEELGVDINIRPAWALSRGEGITVAVADTGVEQAHADLQRALAGAPHFNFSTGLPSGDPLRLDSGGAHGTSCAGLIGATADNILGMSGIAPASQVAAWVIYDADGRSVSTEQIGDMFRYASNIVSIQNHSWGPTGRRQRGPDALEEAGMASAWEQGRGGFGTVMIFAAGNDRESGGHANDNGFASDPRVISVTGVTPYGRATAASEPGASILLAAPTGDDESGGLFTTDISGTSGANFISFCPPFEYLSDFRWGALGFKHTSAAAPLVSGIAALALSVNPDLTARDVQQVLLLSSWHADLADPDLNTNAVGLAVSHNVGFGIVNAGEAVRLAQSWSNRPSASRLTRGFTGAFPIPIPDGGLRVEVSGEQIPAELATVSGISGFGIQPDRPMEFLPLAYIGRATNAPPQRLDGQGALIERGDILYDQKLATAAAAGAQFAVVFNLENAAPGSCPGGDQLCVPTGTDYSPIPVIFIGRTAGLALRDLIQTNLTARVRIALYGPSLPVLVTESWQCERVGVRLRTDFTVRGDLRITLTSPSGTTSILQRYNGDTSPGPVDWTYWNTHDYFEPSAGIWTLSVTDEAPGEGTGQILEASLILDGVPILDSDHDGIDDDWELTQLATLEYGANDDPDDDGYSILRESLEGSNPLVDERPTSPEVGFFSDSLVRVSWSGRTGETYRLRSGAGLESWDNTRTIPGRFPVTSTIIPEPMSGRGFFSVDPISAPAE